MEAKKKLFFLYKRKDIIGEKGNKRYFPDPNNITDISINNVFLLTIWKNMYIKPRTVATNKPIKPMIVIAWTALNHPVKIHDIKFNEFSHVPLP